MALNLHDRWRIFAKDKKTLKEARPDIFEKFAFPEYFKRFVVERKDGEAILWVSCVEIPFIDDLRRLMGKSFEIRNFEGHNVTI